MIASVLLTRCHAAGLRVRAGGDELIITVPDTTDESAAQALLQELAAHKPGVIAHLCPPPQNPHNPQYSAKADDAVRNRVTRDPRPDLTDDSRLWGWLLKLAMAEYGDEPDSVLGALHFVRSGGAELRQEDGRLRIVPRFSPKVAIEGEDGEPLELADETAWSTPAEWERTKAEVLEPHREAISLLTCRVSERHIDRRALEAQAA